MRSTRRQTLAWLTLVAAGSAWRPAFAAADDEDNPIPPNVFISPCGQPFRAKDSAPYASADWFHQADANKDGKLDRAEFVADAAAFFKTLDVNGDGVLSPPEVARYEHRIAPEILGYRIRVTAQDRAPFVRDGARLWLAQVNRPGEIDPGGGVPNEPEKPKPLDESTKGAAPYSLFDEPEPVMAADLNFDGIIRQKNFLKLADLHFNSLDPGHKGFLTLETLPTTPVQEEILRAKKHHGSDSRPSKPRRGVG